MKIGILTDTHYGIRNDAPVFYDYFCKSVDNFISVCKENNVSDVIHLGDLYDRRKYINFVTAKRSREDLLQKLSDNFKVVTILSGNHDEYYKNTHVVNSLDELVGGRYPNVALVTEPTTMRYDDFPLFLVPWITDSNRSKFERELKETDAHVAMGHFEFQGYQEQKGIYSLHGLDPKNFEKFSAVYSGHFHHRHQIDNIQYIGAFAEYTWADYNGARGFCIFDTETQTMDFHQNPYNMFHMLPYDDDKDKNIQKTIKTMETDKYANTFVRVVVANKTNPFVFDKLLEKIEKAQPYDISVVEDVSTFAETDESIEIDQSEDTPTILTKYVDGLTLGVDNGKLKNLMLSLYKEAATLETI